MYISPPKIGPVFIDLINVQLRGSGSEAIWTFCRPSEQLKERDISTYWTGKAVKQMFWAAFGEDFCTGIVPLDGDPNSPRGERGVNGQVISDLYQAYLPEVVQPGHIFMHDGAGPHCAHIVQDVLEELQIEVMIWPPYSPDLNPIENLWSVMKKGIYRLYPELECAPDTEGT